MTKEELIGRKFTYMNDAKPIYTFTRTGSKSVLLLAWVDSNGSRQTLGWDANEALKVIEKGTWKLLPEESNMYKTKGGIEYGVDSKFILGKSTGENLVYIIKKVEDDGIFYKLEELDKPNATPIKLNKEFFDEQVDKGHWNIIQPMKDYKQVDPKTITFDFTNTKIKVNNEDESKWIQEVAFVNGKQWGFGGKTISFTQQPYLFFGSSITHSSLQSTFDTETTFKEITIQDILNNMRELDQSNVKVGDILTLKEGIGRYARKLVKVVEVSSVGCRFEGNTAFDTWVYINSRYQLNNMREVIEVGDVVVLSSYPKEDQYEVTKIEGEKIYITNLGNWAGGLKGETGHNPASGLTIVKKGKQKEIVGYETVVDLPGIPKCSKSEVYMHGSASFKVKAGTYTLYVAEQLADTKFFKPIYKQDAVELKFSKYTATLSKEHGLVFTDGEKLSFEHTKQLIGQLHSEFNLPKVGAYKATVKYKVESVKVGCKSFTPEDVKLVSEAIKKLN